MMIMSQNYNLGLGLVYAENCARYDYKVFFTRAVRVSEYI